MLAANTYTQDYIDARRAAVAAQLSAYDAVVKAAGGAVDGFARPFFKNMVVVLEASFVHRTRAREGKDGNPLNEVRVLAASILENDGVLLADKQIRLKPETSVLGLAPGDEISLSAADFRRLADGFFAGIEEKFGPES